MPIQRIAVDEPVLASIGKIADEQGIIARAVGGFVRDLIMGTSGKDIDIVVLGDGVRFAESIARGLKCPPPVVFERFGTAMLTIGDVKVECVGARKESYAADSRKPAVETGTLDDDLLRRDFTINAMAIALNSSEWGTLIDPFKGRRDIEKRLLRTPLDPEKTFSDDPLRMMRAVRFVAQLGFSVEDRVLDAIRTMKDRMEIVSMERVGEEFVKMMASPNPSSGLALMFETGLSDVVFPELSAMAGVEQRQEYHHKDVLRHTLKVLENVCGVSENVWLRIAALLHDVAKPRTKDFKHGIGWTFHGHEEVGARMVKPIFRRLRLPISRVPYVEKLVRLHLRPMALVDHEVTDSAVRRLMFDAGDEIDDLMILCNADITSKNLRKVDRIRRNYDLVLKKMEEVETKDKIRSWQPPLRGEEIMEICDLPAGPLIGAFKDAITNAILDGTIAHDREEARVYLLSIREEILAQFKMTGKAPKIPRDELFRGKLPPFEG